jgi:ubiquinone/menaquinone biosynthesis C-methylase UbiE
LNHTDHLNLLRDGIPEPGGIWADLGSGAGAFTLALAELIGSAGTIHAVDKRQGALAELHRAMHARFPQVTLHTLAADFTHPLDLPPLDGVVMANSLHFVRKKDRVLRLVHSYLKPGGRLIVVEYNTDQGNRWVPHPFSYPTWESMAHRNGFVETQLLATRPSRFLGEIYSAVSLLPDGQIKIKNDRM